jgi:hypothetical protein
MVVAVRDSIRPTVSMTPPIIKMANMATKAIRSTIPNAR